MQVLKSLFLALKAFFFKAYFTVALIFDDNLSTSERFGNFFKTFLAFGPIAFIFDKINVWFHSNEGFLYGVLVIIIVNMIFGGIVHNRKRDFDWKVMLDKTYKMNITLLLSYLTLEIIMSVAGESDIVTVFRITIQVTTLLYPGSKILKNIFIFSKGEYPPEWLMKKVYNFRENGDLSEFLKSKSDEQK